MVQATLDPQWVPKEILPAKCEILDVIEKWGVFESGGKERKYQYFTLVLRWNGQQYFYDAKFGDKNFLVNTLGVDTDQWIGKTVTVRMGEKYKELA